jgi:hypothetical protein
MTAGFVGLLALTCGLLGGYLLCMERVWRVEQENVELRRDLAYATGHPSTRGAHVVKMQGRRR